MRGRFKEDIARSVDQYNRWFLKFAPKTCREERVKATEYVAGMLGRTNHLRNLTLKELVTTLQSHRYHRHPHTPKELDAVILAGPQKDTAFVNSLAYWV